MIKKGDIVAYIYGGEDQIYRMNPKNRGLWEVTKINRNNEVSLTSVTCNAHSFIGTTKNTGTRNFVSQVKNLVKLDTLIKLGVFKRNYFSDAALGYSKDITNKTKVKQKVKNKNMVTRTMDSNVDAAKVAATITAGKTINKVVFKKIKGKLPVLVRGYADTALGTVVLANVMDFMVKQFAADNTKAAFAADAMMQAAMVELMAEFDFAAMLEEILSSVSLPEAE